MKSFILYFYILLNLFSCLINPAFAEIILPADIVEGQDSSKSWIKNSHFEKNVNSVSSYADAAGTSPVDGTGGSATITCTRTTSSPISGDGSLLITKDAANRQGQGCSIPFTIDRGDRATMQTIVLPYEVASGTFTAGTDSTNSDLVMWVYDVTNSSLIPVQGTGRFYSNTADYFYGYFQTNSNSTSYRLIFHQALTGTSAYTIKVDNIKIFKSKFSSGTTITDWVSYTPGTTQGFGSVSSVNLQSRRVGDTLQVRGRWTNGTVNTSEARLSLGYSGVSGNVTIDASKITSTQPVGSYLRNLADTSVVTYYVLAQTGGLNYVNFSRQTSGATPITLATGAEIADSTTGVSAVQFEVPITGWSSSTQQSDGYDGRLVAARYTNAAGTLIPTSIGTAPWATKDYDTTGSFSSDIFTASSSGIYEVSLSMSTQSQAWAANSYFYAGLAKNGTSVTQTIAQVNVNSAITTGVALAGTAQISLVAGDTLRIRYLCSDSGHNLTASSVDNWVTFKKLQSPTTISATELTQFYTYTGSPTGTLSGSYNTVTYGTGGTYYDTHGAYSGGVYTLRKSGCFDVKGSVQITHTTAAGFLDVGISFNGAAPFVADYKYVTGNGDTTQSVSGTMCGKSGDTFRIQSKTNLTTPAYSSGAAYNYFILSERK